MSAISAKAPTLPLCVHSKIYDYLNNPPVYKRVCRFFHYFFKNVHPYFSEIEIFIHENYQVIGGYPSKIDIKRFLCCPHFILTLGDDHCEAMHKRLNAALVNSIHIHTFNQVFIEGGKESLKVWKKQNLLYFKDLSPDITVQTWDIDLSTDKARKVYDKCLSHSIRVVKIIQDLFRLYQDPKKWSLQNLYSFLDRTFDDVSVNEILDECIIPKEKVFSNKRMDLLKFSNISKGTQTFVKAMLKEAMLRQIEQDFASAPSEVEKDFNEILAIRDFQLWDTVMKAKKKSHVVALAGIDHIYTVCKSLSSHLPGSINYLCLIPHKNSSSLYRTKRKKTLSPETALTDSLSFNLNQQIGHLLSSDCSQMDWNTNHHSGWLSFARSVGRRERDRLIKILPNLKKQAYEDYGDEFISALLK